MCGIVGVLANRSAPPLIYDALRRLEYRGYDSAGIAAIEPDGHLARRRALGHLSALGDVLDTAPLGGSSAIGHTRWATHGSPSVENAHPHRSGPVAVVHNGIIENYREIKQELQAKGISFHSQTDSEVISALCASYLKAGLSYEDASAATLAKLQGAYALCFLFDGADDLMICARRGSPLVVGFGDAECFVGSDAIALTPLTDRIAYLEEGDWAVLTRNSATIFDASGGHVTRKIHQLKLEDFIADKGQHRHFMAKEIHEQPMVAARLLGQLVDPQEGKITLDTGALDWTQISRLNVIACGTAYLAGQFAKIWIEEIAQLPVDLEIASEFRYRKPPLSPRGVTVVISQSGDTADTLAALRYAKSQGQNALAFVNVPSATIARESDIVVPTQAGPEIGVASTKAFTTQLVALLCLALKIAHARKEIDAKTLSGYTDLLATIPRIIAQSIAQNAAYKALAADIKNAQSALFLGRGLMYPLALEGALKLKEISYIHAEGFAAGELKHGPIALVDEAIAIIALAPSDRLFEKTASNLREVVARNGRIHLITDTPGAQALAEDIPQAICLPEMDGLIAPFAYAAAVQLIAYHTAVARGTDVDQPRNLAKSVTVE